MSKKTAMVARAWGVVFVVTLGELASTRASAEPLRLRADAYADTREPAGLVVLQGEDAARPWLGVEALVWGGARTDATADVLVLSFRAREPHGYAELRGGRFVLATGAVRPVHMDGASAIVRSRAGTTAEVFGGMPVVPRFGDRPYDWLAGGRVAQSIASRATIGVSYLQRREHGDLSGEEVGGDLAAVPADWLDVAARAAYDVVSPGFAEALVSAATRSRPWRFELFGTHRSASRLLPATSLFSVLGDLPSQTAGGTVRWYAAPRLDLLASAAAQSVGGELGGNGWVRATLRLDDRGAGSMGLELRRQDASTAKWSGVRGIFTKPITRDWRTSSEIEIVVPDHPRGRGVAWPWGLLSIAWRFAAGWEAAAAAEAASTPEHLYELNALFRASYTFEAR